MTQFTWRTVLFGAMMREGKVDGKSEIERNGKRWDGMKSGKENIDKDRWGTGRR